MEKLNSKLRRFFNCPNEEEYKLIKEGKSNLIILAIDYSAQFILNNYTVGKLETTYFDKLKGIANVSETDVIVKWLIDIKLKRSFENKELLKMLKDIPAESLFQEWERVCKKTEFINKDYLSLSFLRTKFKSVYD